MRRPQHLLVALAVVFIATPASADVGAKLSASVAAVDASCKGKLDRSGRCLKTTTKTDATHCTGKRATTRSLRITNKLRTAKTRLEAAIKSFEALPEVDRNVHAQAAIAGYIRLGDLAAEQALVLAFPRLEFPPDRPKVTKRNTEKSGKWLKRLHEAGNQATAYWSKARVLASKGGTTGALLADRYNTLSSGMADVIEAGYKPRLVRTGKFAKDLTEAYCAQLADLAKQLRPTPQKKAP